MQFTIFDFRLTIFQKQTVGLTIDSRGVEIFDIFFKTGGAVLWNSYGEPPLYVREIRSTKS